MSDCEICCETTTKIVKCSSCDHDVCRPCAERYIVDVIARGGLATCAFCNSEYSEDVMYRFFTKSWRLNQLKNAREKALLEVEKAKYPTRYRAFMENMHPRLMQELRNIFYWASEIKDLVRNGNGVYNYVYSEANLWRCRTKINRWSKWLESLDDKSISSALKELEDVLRDLERRREQSKYYKNLRRWAREQAYVRFLNPERKVPLRTFSKPCPSSKCFGFLSKGLCGTCHVSYCEKCLEPNVENHTCDPDLVETVKLMTKTSVPCPKCQTYIHKVDGCNLMWCTLCHQTFDYKTGQMTFGRNHNPMYYDWLRRDGAEPPREIGDEVHDPCHSSETEILSSLQGEAEDVKTAHALCRLLLEFQTGHHYDMYWYTQATNADDTEERQKAYLFERMMLGTEEEREKQWHVELQRIEKHFRKIRSYRSIADTFLLVARESLQSWHRGGRPPSFDDQIEEAIEFFNQKFEFVGKALNNRYPQIHRVGDRLVMGRFTEYFLNRIN